MWGDGGAYATWTTYLREWSVDLRTTDEQLPVLAREDFAPQTWIRLTNHVIDAINARIRAWTTALTTELSSARGEHAVGQALVSSRMGLASILRLAAHPSLPEELRAQLRAQVERQVAELQQSLLDQVRDLHRQGWTRAAAEARLQTFRESPLTAVLTHPAAEPTAPSAAPTPDPWAFDSTQRPRRHLVVD